MCYIQLMLLFSHCISYSMDVLYWNTRVNPFKQFTKNCRHGTGSIPYCPFLILQLHNQTETKSLNKDCSFGIQLNDFVALTSISPYALPWIMFSMFCKEIVSRKMLPQKIKQNHFGVLHRSYQSLIQHRPTKIDKKFVSLTFMEGRSY